MTSELFQELAFGRGEMVASTTGATGGMATPCDLTGVGVCVGTNVSVGTGVAVMVGVTPAVRVMAGVTDALAVGLRVAVGVGVSLAAGVTLSVGVPVGVPVAVRVTVADAVSVTVGDSSGAGVAPSSGLVGSVMVDGAGVSLSDVGASETTSGDVVRVGPGVGAVAAVAEVGGTVAAGVTRAAATAIAGVSVGAAAALTAVGVGVSDGVGGEVDESAGPGGDAAAGYAMLTLKALPAATLLAAKEAVLALSNPLKTSMPEWSRWTASA
jgi:hypothetical protein